MRNLFQLTRQAILGILFFTFIGLTAHASYTVSSNSNLKFDPQKPVHIVISGRGNDLGTEPMIASLAKARRIATIMPNEQILILNVQDGESAEQNSNIEAFNFQLIRAEPKVLDVNTLMHELEIFHKIASIDFYGHSGIEPGSFLDGIGDNDLKWRPLNRISARLVGHFTSDSYVVLNGCNEGQLQAPELSKIWKIPVAGTLTSSHFEVLFSDGKFYWDDEKNRREFSSHSEKTLRMKPDNVVYQGIYGNYLTGLPFFKFFCVGISNERCLTGMRASVYSIVGVGNLNEESSQEDYLKVVREWLCPNPEYGSNAQSDCITKLQKITELSTDKTYTPFNGSSPQCSFESCYSKSCFASGAAMSNCAKMPLSNSQLSNESETRSTTFVDEYLSYTKAFNYGS